MSGEANSFAYLTQRLSVAVQRGNAASVLGTMKVDSEDEEFYLYISFFCIYCFMFCNYFNLKVKHTLHIDKIDYEPT